MEYRYSLYYSMFWSLEIFIIKKIDSYNLNMGEEGNWKIFVSPKPRMVKYWLYLFSYREIWARFLAFESNIGDLASILQVEKRRFTAFKEEYEGKETALLVDRYKFMDLYPCSASELKALGYKVCTWAYDVCDVCTFPTF